MNNIFSDTTPSTDKWGGDNAKMMSYAKWGLLAVVALWLLKKLRIF